MRLVKPASILAVLLMTLFVSGMAYADGHLRGGGHYSGHYWGRGHHSGSRVGVGVVIGGPIWGPPWYYPYYYPYYPYYYPYYYPPAVAVPSTPPEYIERSEPEPSSAPTDVWYYCPDSRTYYPYVKECPGGWQTVPAQPPSEPAR